MTFQDIVDILPSHIQKKLEELKSLRERPDFHPEENCYEHIKIVTERCLQHGDKDLVMSGIFHDIHKLDTMKINPKTGYPTSPGHDKWAQKTVETDEEVRATITQFGADPDLVAGICGQHMRIHQIGKMKAIKKMRMIDLPFFKKLAIFSTFDNMLYSDKEAHERAGVASETVQEILKHYQELKITQKEAQELQREIHQNQTERGKKCRIYQSCLRAATNDSGDIRFPTETPIITALLRSLELSLESKEVKLVNFKILAEEKQQVNKLISILDSRLAGKYLDTDRNPQN